MNINQTVCPKCQRPLPRPKAWHYCAQINIDSLFEGKSEALVYLFDKILADVFDWQGVAVSATKNCIVFVRHKTFLVIRPMKTQLDVKFYLSERREEPPIFKSIFWNNKYSTQVRLGDIDEYNSQILRWIKHSYDIS